MVHRAVAADTDRTRTSPCDGTKARRTSTSSVIRDRRVRSGVRRGAFGSVSGPCSGPIHRTVYILRACDNKSFATANQSPDRRTQIPRCRSVRVRWYTCPEPRGVESRCARAAPRTLPLPQPVASSAGGGGWCRCGVRSALLLRRVGVAYSSTSMHGHSPTCEWINMKDRVQAAAWRQRLRRGSGRDRVREPACLPPRLPACPDAAAGRHEDRPCEAPPGRLATCGA